MAIIRIPWQFYQDHKDRALPTPVPVAETQHHYWVDSHDPAYQDLIADAEWYAGTDGTPGTDYKPMTIAARQLLNAIRPDRPTGRICLVCGRSKGVTFHAAEVNGRMASIPAHVPCFRRWRSKRNQPAK